MDESNVARMFFGVDGSVAAEPVVSKLLECPWCLRLVEQSRGSLVAHDAAYRQICAGSGSTVTSRAKQRSNV